jgi:hypothetical protein
VSFVPTAEQKTALAAFETGESMVIEAGAGTGKTSTLRLFAESTDRKGLYLAYNKAIQTDAAKDFPSNCQCKTAHSVAYGYMMRSHPNGQTLINRLRSPRLPSRQAVSLLGIPAGGYQVNPEEHIPAWIISRSATLAVRRFCNSADEEILDYHVPKLDGIKDASQGAYKRFVAPFARKAWEDITSPQGRLQFEHDHYLKLWALSHPVLKVDFVLLDEAQDANPVIAKVVEDQTHAQRIMVGDTCQAIYGWRGAIDAMSNFTATHRLVLSQSFRFGPAVAAEANKFLNLLDAPLRLTGFEKIESTVAPLGDADAILCRTNATVIEQAMAAQETGKKVAIVGGTNEIKRFTEAARDLQQGQSVSHADLAMFKTWYDVLEYVGNEEGADLKVMVKIIQTYGIETILDVCKNSVNEDSADLIVSTAHKAKGREWNRVRIANDFNAPEEGQEPSRPEMMLMYVGVTRARLQLDCTTLSWVKDLA